MPMLIVAVLLTTAIFCLIVLGGVVHSTGSSLACPDWPTCHGTLFPELSGGVLFEHSHRVLASWVALIAVGLGIWARVSSWGTPALLRSTRILVLLLAVQVLLGAATVRYGLPAAVSTAHLATALLFFATSIGITHALLERTASERPYGPGVQRWASAALLLTFVQMVAGGVVRHSGASLSCTEFPWCDALRWQVQGQVLPLVHMSHRLLAVALVVSVVGLCIRVLREPGKHRGLRAWAALAAALTAAQPALGFWSVSSRLDPAVVTLHLAAGVLLFGSLAVLRLELGRDSAAPATSAGAEHATFAASSRS